MFDNFLVLVFNLTNVYNSVRTLPRKTSPQDVTLFNPLKLVYPLFLQV
jgi:hypothetical protein